MFDVEIDKVVVLEFEVDWKVCLVFMVVVDVVFMVFVFVCLFLLVFEEKEEEEDVVKEEVKRVEVLVDIDIFVLEMVEEVLVGRDGVIEVFLDVIDVFERV